MSGRARRAIDVAADHLGRREVIGPRSDSAILAMLQLDNKWPTDDATPWCSAFVAWCAFQAGYKRSTSLRARSWIAGGKAIWTQGDDVEPSSVMQEGDVLVFSRGSYRPGPEVLRAPGHVGFYTGRIEPVRNYQGVWVLGGNQGNAVSIKPYSMASLLAVRRLVRDPTVGFRRELAG